MGLEIIKVLTAIAYLPPPPVVGKSSSTSNRQVAY